MANAIIAVIISIVLLGTLNEASGNFQVYTRSKITNLRLEPMNARKSGLSKALCASECETTADCVSFSYHSSKLCEVNRYNPNDILAANFTEDHWEMYVKYEGILFYRFTSFLIIYMTRNPTFGGIGSISIYNLY